MKYPNLILNLEAELAAIQKEISEKEPAVPFNLLDLEKEFKSGIAIIKAIDGFEDYEIKNHNNHLNKKILN